MNRYPIISFPTLLLIISIAFTYVNQITAERHAQRMHEETLLVQNQALTSVKAMADSTIEEHRRQSALQAQIRKEADDRAVFLRAKHEQELKDSIAEGQRNLSGAIEQIAAITSRTELNMATVLDRTAKQSSVAAESAKTAADETQKTRQLVSGLHKDQPVLNKADIAKWNRYALDLKEYRQAMLKDLAKKQKKTAIQQKKDSKPK